MASFLPTYFYDQFKVTKIEAGQLTMLAALMGLPSVWLADHFYHERVDQHLRIGIRAIELLREQGVDQLHSRKLRSFAELVRRIKAHTATWINLELITSEKLAVLNPKLDQLIAALEQSNKQAIHTAAVEVFQETFIRQRGLHHGKIDSDDDNEDPQAINLEQVNSAVTMKVQPVENQALNRVAARALAFEVMYLLTRAYIGK